MLAMLCKCRHHILVLFRESSHNDLLLKIIATNPVPYISHETVSGMRLTRPKGV